MDDYEWVDAKQLHFLDSLKVLNLESTNLSLFSKILVFKDLPQLDRLILNNNPFKEFGREICGFPKLRHVSAQMSQLQEPVCLFELSAFQGLESLNIKHSPVSNLRGNAYVRMRAIAEIQNLRIINGAYLKKYERKDSEIFYLKEAFREYFTLRGVPDYDYDYNDFLAYCEEFHPNIPRLIKKYGNPYEVEKDKKIQ